MKTKKFLITIAAVTMGVLFLGAGCSNNSGSTSTSAPETTSSTPISSETPVSIENSAFNPQTITVTTGTTVTWTNNDTTDHTVTSDSGLFDSGHVAAGNTFTYTFNDPGEFTYHCSINTTMTGTVTVQ